MEYGCLPSVVIIYFAANCIHIISANRGADLRRGPCKQAQLDCAVHGVRSSTLFRRVAARNAEITSRKEKTVINEPQSIYKSDFNPHMDLLSLANMYYWDFYDNIPIC